MANLNNSIDHHAVGPDNVYVNRPVAVSVGPEGERSSTRSSLTPTLHKHHPEEGTVGGASLNTLCNVMGAGVLSLPFAMHNGSISISIFLLLISAGLGAFSVYVLTYACEVTKKFSYTECLAYSLFPDGPLSAEQVDEEDIDEGIYNPLTETKQHRYRRWITMFMECIIFCNNFGALVIYARVIADSIPPVLRDFFGASGVWTSSVLWLIAPAVLFFVLSCARKMDELKWTSLVGFLTIMYIVIMVVVRYFTNIYNPIDTDPAVDDIHWFRVSVGCFATLSTYALAFGYHFNVPYFYKELKDRTPAKMMETVKNAFPIITVSYGTTGLLGYLTFGALVASSKAEGNIVNNFAEDDIIMNVGRLGLFFHFASVYPILSVCARRGMHRFTCLLFVRPPTPEELEHEKSNMLIERHRPPPGDPSTTSLKSIIIEAFIIVSLGTVLAAFVPGIGIVVEFIGTMFGIPLMLTFPGLMGYQIFNADIPAVKDTNWRLAKIMSVVLIVSGTIFLICGLVAFAMDVS